jgi:hypothetical protein
VLVALAGQALLVETSSRRQRAVPVAIVVILAPVPPCALVGSEIRG